jgi:hypothetical protein
MPGAEEHEVVYEAYQRGPRPIDSWMATVNAVDFQHLHSLHGFPTIEPDTMKVGEYTLEWRIERENFLQEGLITGINTFTQRLKFGDYEILLLLTGAPVDHGKSMAFYTIATRSDQSALPAGQPALPDKMRQLKAFADKLNADDAPILNTMRFRKGVLVASDRHVARFLKFAKEFPQAVAFDA